MLEGSTTDCPPVSMVGRGKRGQTQSTRRISFTRAAAMSGFDADRVYSVSVHQNAPSFSTESPSETEKLLLDFLLQYRLGGEFTYRYAFLSSVMSCAETFNSEINSGQIYS